MAGEKTIEKSELADAVLESDPSTKLVEQDVASGKDGTPSVLTSSISSSEDATSSIKGETGQESVAEQGVYYPPTSCYDYYYPGYNGTFSQLDDHNFFNSAGGSYTGMQSDNASLLYYLPGYNPYTTGSFMGVDGQQPYYSSPGYLQHPVSYGSEAMPSYSWDSAHVGDVNGTNAFSGKAKPGIGSNASTKANSFSSTKSSSTVSGKLSTLPLDSKSRKSAAPSNIYKSVLDNQPHRTMGKFSSGHQSTGLMKGIHPIGKYSSFVNQNRGPFMYNGPANYRPNGRAWNGDNRTNLRDRNGEFDASTELRRGPRSQNGSNPSNQSADDEQAGPTIKRNQCNLEEFQTQYDNAKFYVIKSYSEDDIHKCIKYDVWSSTLNGNRKLAAAFLGAEAKAGETATKCPVFLFFSVNGSGQFVGIAEMIGPVDFNKDMDFWQLDKWNGFFPVKWHIIKDIPNTLLKHIILENNEGKPVTHSRDTQEIGREQGLEMLNIFKSHSAKTSVLDDFYFYENREKLLKANRNSNQSLSRTERYENNNIPMHVKPGERATKEAARVNGSSDPTVSLINLTKNISLNSHP